MSSHRSPSVYASPPSSPPSSPTSASSQERLILVPDDQFESDALLGLWPDDEEAPVTPTTANIERPSSAPSNAPALPPRAIIPLLIGPCLKLGTTYIPRAVEIGGPVPALVGLAGMALLSAFTSQVWVLLARYVSRWTIEEIVAEALIRNPGRRGSPKDKWKRRIRKSTRVLVTLTALLLCATYLHESAHMLQPALPIDTNYATQAGTTVILAAVLVPLVSASSLAERKVLWSNFLSIILQLVIAIVGVVHYFHSQDEPKHIGTKRGLPKWTRSRTEAGTWEAISILSFAFANQLLALPLYTALVTNFAAKPTFAPRPRTRRMITSFPMLLLVSTVISLALTVPLILAPLTKHAAPPDPTEAVPTVSLRPPLRETLTLKLEAAIPTIQVFALLLAVPPLFAGAIVPRVRQRSYRWALFFSAVLLAAVIPGRKAGLTGLSMTLSLLTCYVVPALLHAIFHGLRRPRSILFTNPNAAPTFTSSEPGSSNDPEALLQHKERSLQRRRLARRVLWDVGVWGILGPVGTAATVWTAGRTIGVW